MTRKTITRLIVVAGCLATALLIGLVISVGAARDSARDRDSARSFASTVQVFEDDEKEHHRCSERTVRGSYAFALQGNVIGIGPIAASGTTTFDGEGAGTIRVFINTTTAAPAIEASLAGSYTVNGEDCTGSATFAVPAPGLFGLVSLHFEAVIVNKGEEIRYLITTPGVVFAGASVRQFPSVHSKQN